jgi:chromosome partitioning protein
VLSPLGPRPSACQARAWRTGSPAKFCISFLVLPQSEEPISADLPPGAMAPVGYVIMQPAMRFNRPVAAYSRTYQRWLQRIPVVYAESVLGRDSISLGGKSHEIATLRNYQSLMPLAYDAHKPMFDLRPGDGALGATADFVHRCYEDFEILARDVASRLGLEPRAS